MLSFIESVQKQFLYYKHLGDAAMVQLDERQLIGTINNGKVEDYHNSISIIVNHISGNMKSRWTNIFEEDGEKEWRDRDAEFSNVLETKDDVKNAWEEGWECLFKVINNLTIDDLQRSVYIRKMEHSLIEAIHRQMMHYAYHIGQIVFIAKECKGDKWQSLSIPLGNSKIYNKEKFSLEKRKEHFTDEYLNKNIKK